MTTTHNVHPEEIAKFSALAERWWDPEGEFKTLHQINPLRMDFIRRHCPLEGARVVDVGCGGGILSEALARSGAHVIGIDMSEALVEMAELHALDAGLDVHYQHTSAEALAAHAVSEFDAVTCMEMLEHVPDPVSVVAACAQLVKPGGWVFFSTLNRHPKAYLLAIAAAEYILRMLPRGTHRYETFIKPSELSRWARQYGLQLQALAGISYQPLTRRFRLSRDTDVNYLAAFQREV